MHMYKITVAETAAFWCPRSFSWTPSKTDRRRPRRTPSAVSTLSRSRPARRSSPISLLRPSSWNDEIWLLFHSLLKTTGRLMAAVWFRQFSSTRIVRRVRRNSQKLPNRFTRNVRGRFADDLRSFVSLITWLPSADRRNSKTVVSRPRPRVIIHDHQFVATK